MGDRSDQRPERPLRLLWAITHLTLMRSEPHVLAEAGFDVSLQETVGEFVHPIDLLELEPESEFRRGRAWVGDDHDRVGPRSRIMPRSGDLTEAEIAAIGSEFDVIVIADAISARRLAGRFRGVVVHRDFGRLPGALPPPDDPEDREGRLRADRPGRLVHVPILGTIEPASTVEYDDRVVLRTVAPPLVGAASRPRSGERIVNVFATEQARRPWFLPWLADLVESSGASRVRLFGTGPGVAAGARRVGAEWLPRLPKLEYGRLFSDADVWVYPFADRIHSHYIPLEAISLGIPCVLCEGTAVVEESDRAIGARRRDFGVVDGVGSMRAMVAELLAAPDHAAEVAANQMSLLDPFSADALASSADQLRDVVHRIVVDDRDRVERSSVGDPADIGIPSGATYLGALRDGLPRSARVDASVIAFADRFRGEFAVELTSSGTSPSALTDARPVFGDPTSFILGAPSHVAGVAGRFAVRCVTSGDPGAPVALRVRSIAEPLAALHLPIITAVESADGVEPTIAYDFVADVRPEEWITVVTINALVRPGFVLHRFEIERVDPATTAVERSIETMFRNGDPVPCWPAMVLSRRSPGRRSRLLRGFPVVRVACAEIGTGEVRPVFATDDRSDRRSGRPIGIVIARRPRRIPFRIAALRAGGVRWTGRPFAAEKAFLHAWGNRPMLRSLGLQRASVAERDASHG